MFNREDIIWAAGLFEGEGNINWFRQQSYNPMSKHYYSQISLGSTDKDVVDKFYTIFKLGKVYGPYQKKIGLKPFYQYKCSIPEHVYAMVVAILPWLGQRRTSKCLEWIEWFKTHHRSRKYKRKGK